jgi:hypothetical protein
LPKSRRELKSIVVILLVIIAAGVGYLAYTKYQERERAQELAEERAHPGMRTLKSLARLAKLECANGFDIVETRQAPAGAVPSKFTCLASTGTWMLVERECREREKNPRTEFDKLQTGAPTMTGDVFHPLPSICWQVTEQR